MQEVLSVGELVSLRWQLGVSVQSNQCENLDSPYVAVQVKVKDANGEASLHSFDLSLLEFKVRGRNQNMLVFPFVFLLLC